MSKLVSTLVRTHLKDDAPTIGFGQYFWSISYMYIVEMQVSGLLRPSESDVRQAGSAVRLRVPRPLEQCDVVGLDGTQQTFFLSLSNI